ncbi:hypothetical protein BLAT2472_80106 [Burkholderia latens]
MNRTRMQASAERAMANTIRDRPFCICVGRPHQSNGKRAARTPHGLRVPLSKLFCRQLKKFDTPFSLR